VGIADADSQLVAVQTLTTGAGSRSSSSAPRAIPRLFMPSDDAGLIAWYDAALASSITQSGNVVASWTSRAGTGLLTAFDAPTSGTRTIAGKNAIDFTGTARMAGPITVPSNGNLAFHMAVAIDSVTSAFAAVISATATRDFQIDSGVEGAFAGRMNVRSIGDTYALQGGPFANVRVFSVVFDRTGSGTTRVLVNGVQVGTGVYSTALDTTLALGLMTNRTQNAYVDGAVGELIATANLAATDDHVAHLLRKWGTI
jgi:hypothetical protein